MQHSFLAWNVLCTRLFLRVLPKCRMSQRFRTIQLCYGIYDLWPMTFRSIPEVMHLRLAWLTRLEKDVINGLYNRYSWINFFVTFIILLLLFRERAPISSRLNAVDFYLVICVFLVFTALMEYAVILLLLKKQRKPEYSINAGLKKMFNNGDAVTNTRGTGASSPQSALEEAKRMTVVSYPVPTMHSKGGLISESLSLLLKLSKKMVPNYSPEHLLFR